MKDKASVSHDEVMVKRLRESPAFAAEYLKAAIEDTEEPRVLLVALRQVAEGEEASPRWPRRPGSSGKPLPRFVAAGQSASFHALRRDPSNGTDADGRDFTSNAPLNACREGRGFGHVGATGRQLNFSFAARRPSNHTFDASSLSSSSTPHPSSQSG